MILSIIIPVYNVEPYIAKCLYSCVCQDIDSSDYEIIVVNDGTKDNSMVVVERIAREHNNVKVINQENKGLSGARNTGLKESKGEYVWFVDSDDFIENNCLSRICGLLTDDLDILQLQYRLVYEDDTPESPSTKYYINGIQSGYEVTLKGGLPAPAPFSIFRRAFLVDNNLEFVLNIYHEDSEFKPRAVYLAKKITTDTELSYNYLQRKQGSIMSHYSIKRFRDVLTVNNNLYQFSQPLTPKIRRAFNNYIGYNMNSLLFDMRGLPDDERTNSFMLFKENKHLFRCMINSNRIKFIVEGVVFCISIRLGLSLHKMFR